MLYQLGQVHFEVAPLNVEEVDHNGEASYAAKEVLGRRPPEEFVGAGPRSA